MEKYYRVVYYSYSDPFLEGVTFIHERPISLGVCDGEFIENISVSFSKYSVVDLGVTIAIVLSSEEEILRGNSCHKEFLLQHGNDYSKALVVKDCWECIHCGFDDATGILYTLSRQKTYEESGELIVETDLIESGVAKVKGFSSGTKDKETVGDHFIVKRRKKFATPEDYFSTDYTKSKDDKPKFNFLSGVYGFKLGWVFTMLCRHFLINTDLIEVRRKDYSGDFSHMIVKLALNKDFTMVYETGQLVLYQNKPDGSQVPRYNKVLDSINDEDGVFSVISDVHGVMDPF